MFAFDDYPWPEVATVERIEDGRHYVRMDDGRRWSYPAWWVARLRRARPPA